MIHSYAPANVHTLLIMASAGFICMNICIRIVLVNFIYACFNIIVQCDEHNLFQSQRQNRLLLRHPRADDSDSFSTYSFGTAASFGGRNEFLKLQFNNDVRLPNTEFSVQLWIKPEGGQYRYTPIIGTCIFIFSLIYSV